MATRDKVGVNMVKANRQKNLIIIKYISLIVIGFFMIYPLLWMVGSAFKSNSEIFGNISPFTKKPVLDGIKKLNYNYGGQINIFKSMINTYSFVIPKVVFTVGSSVLTAYGFSNFRFKGRKILFILLISAFFLPQTVLNVPQFILYNKFGWIDSPLYPALSVPSLFAFDTYFVFMLIQFFKGIPKEIGEAASIDGCGSFRTLMYIFCPILKPAIISCALFQFLWSSNDFMGPLLYVNTPSRYPASIFVKLAMDADSGVAWNRIFATSVISIIPSLLIFFIAQRNFTEGIAYGGIKI